MADSKISALTALTGANVEHLADSIPIVDDSVTTTKKILVSELAKAIEVLATEQASTSGASIDFTGIPAWAKRITVMLVGVSTNGTSGVKIQIGDSGGLETTGYSGHFSYLVNGSSVGSSNHSTGFQLPGNGSVANALHGALTLTLEDATNFTWVAMGYFGLTDTLGGGGVAGSKSLSAALDRVSVVTGNGTDAFDAGAINILYE